MGTSNVLFLLGLGLHLSLVRVFSFPASSKADAILQNTLKIVFSSHLSLIHSNGGTV